MATDHRRAQFLDRIKARIAAGEDVSRLKMDATAGIMLPMLLSPPEGAVPSNAGRRSLSRPGEPQ